MNNPSMVSKADRRGDRMRVICDTVGKGHSKEWKVATFNRGRENGQASAGLWLSDKTKAETHIYAVGGVIPDSGPDVHSTITLECPRCKTPSKVMLRRESLQSIFDSLLSLGIHEVSVLRLGDIAARR